MQKSVMIFIKDAKYYQDQNSIIIVGEEVETKRHITQQITMMALLENLGIFTPEEISIVLRDPERCRLFARNLRDRKQPFRLVFEDSKTDKDDI